MLSKTRRATLLVVAAASPTLAQAPGAASAAVTQNAVRRIDQVMPKVIAWRRDIHQHPELGNREVRTAKLVADHLRSLGIEVRTGVAHTGVVGVLKGARPGPVVALRADMDALPVSEHVDLPFASKVRTTFNGQDVGVMHACGHDNHVAILMGVAEVLAGMRSDLAGSVKFIFQPAEEGPPPGETGGAKMMIDEGALTDPAVDAIFGLHVMPDTVGRLTYREGAILAATDALRIVVRGKQTHGAMPWGGVDPITVSAQILVALQTIPSRQMNVTVAPSIISIGMIQGGVRSNIIPDSVVMVGTVRTLDAVQQNDLHARITRTAEGIAQSAGATAQVTIVRTYPVTVNTPALTARMAPTLRRVARDGKAAITPPVMPSEDFSYFQQKVPAMFFFLGVTPDTANFTTVAANHSPLFFADEKALPVGVRALTQLTLDYMAGGKVVQ
jgi:amidohydrolase